MDKVLIQKVGSNKGFEETLWDAANQLRGNIKYSEYKLVVLSLVFLKLISDEFEVQRQKMITAGLDDFLDLTVFYQQDNIFWLPKTKIFWLPEKARWGFIRQHAKRDDITARIDSALSTIEKCNPSLKGGLPNNYFSRQNLEPQKMTSLIDAIDNIEPFEHETDVESLSKEDFFGRFYEYLLGRFAATEGKGGREFYTPKCVVTLLTKMLEPFQGKIYDPCCGSAGMLVQSVKFAENHQEKSQDISLYGQELNDITYKLAKMNLAIRGLSANLGKRPADTFFSDQHPELKADYILANPPFNQKDWRNESELIKDPRFDGYRIPPVSNANYAWILHMLSRLSANGVAGFVLANASMSSNNSGEGEIRAQLIENDVIDCMIALPGWLFYTTQMSVCLWLITKSKAADETRGYRSRHGETLFIDARHLGTMIRHTTKELAPEDIATIADTYHAWRSSPKALTARIARGDSKLAKYKDQTGFCKVATLREIRDNGYDLTPRHYVVKNLSQMLFDSVAVEKKTLKALSEQLQQIKDSVAVEKKMLKVLSEQLQQTKDGVAVEKKKNTPLLFVRGRQATFDEFDKKLLEIFGPYFKVVPVKNAQDRKAIINYPVKIGVSAEGHRLARKHEKGASVVLEFKLSAKAPLAKNAIYIAVPGSEVYSHSFWESVEIRDLVKKYDLIVTPNNASFMEINKRIKNKTKVMVCESPTKINSKGCTRLLRIVEIFKNNGREEILNSFLRVGTSYKDMTNYAVHHSYFSFFGILRRGLFIRKGRLAYTELVRPKLLSGFKQFCQILPIANKTVVFRSFQQHYTCNPKYVTEALIRKLKEKNKNVKIIWIANKKKVNLSDYPDEVTVIQQNSFAAWYYMSNAKVLVDNNVRATMPVKRKKQIYVQTWHGSLGIKKFTNVWSESVCTAADRTTDLLVSNSKFETEVYRGSVWPTARIEMLGHPRNDIFFADSETKENICARVRRVLGIPDDSEIILYAPTFRDEHLYGTATQKNNISMYLTQFDKIINRFETRFGKKFVVITRVHFHLSNRFNYSNGSKVIDAGSYPDIQELMVASFAGITDYSSWIYDFLLLRGLDLFMHPTSIHILVNGNCIFQLTQRPSHFRRM